MSSGFLTRRGGPRKKIGALGNPLGKKFAVQPPVRVISVKVGRGQRCSHPVNALGQRSSGDQPRSHPEGDITGYELVLRVGTFHVQWAGCGGDGPGEQTLFSSFGSTWGPENFFCLVVVVVVEKGPGII